MAASNGYQAQKAPQIKLETVSPDRNLLRHQLVSLFNQYQTDVDNALAIQQEYEQVIRDARRERRAASARAGKLRRLLDDEFPGWDSPLLNDL